MEELRERSRLLKSVAEDILYNQTIKELNTPVVMSAVKDYLLDNPAEMIKSMYIVSNLTTIVRENINEKSLNTLDIRFGNEYSDRELRSGVISTFNDIIELINTSEEINTVIAECIIDSSDLGFTEDVYEYDTEYLDNWVYGDIIKLSHVAQLPEFVGPFVELFNSMNMNEVYSKIDGFIKNDLGFDI